MINEDIKVTESNKLETIIAKDKQFYMNTFGDRIPVSFVSGRGTVLTDTTGKNYTDFLGGLAVSVLGHSNPKVAAAISNQASTLIHCSNLYYIENQAELAEKLVSLSPGMDRTFFCNSGAEANEAAIKLARAYHYKKGAPRSEIITAVNSFHGRTLATVTATGQEKYNKPFAPLPSGFKYCEFNNAQDFCNSISEKTCAVMLELIQGESGVLPAEQNFISEVSKKCKECDALLIIDEIQTGMGRTGTFFAYEQYDIIPDIVTLAKGLGAGIPIGAVLASENVAKSFAPGDHGSTFGGNPLACAAALAVIEEYKNQNLVKSAKQLGEYFIKSLNEAATNIPEISEIRGKGLMIGIVLRSDIAVNIRKKLHDEGYLVNSIGSTVIRLLPPLIITKTDIDIFIKKLTMVLNQI